MDRFEVVMTKDGSKTLFLTKREVYYHSIHGAVSEAKHVYIEHGLRNINKSSLNILEMGFGTALNALVTFVESSKANLKINYLSVDNYPINYELVKQLDYPFFLSSQDYESLFKRMHCSDWNQETAISPNFNLFKFKSSIETLSIDRKIDLVYYDAFAPKANYNLWSVEIFKNLSRYLNDSAILVTYCANGQVKRNLKAAGFSLETLKGPPGKREMIRATWFQ